MEMIRLLGSPHMYSLLSPGTGLDTMDVHRVIMLPSNKALHRRALETDWTKETAVRTAQQHSLGRWQQTCWSYVSQLTSNRHPLRGHKAAKAFTDFVPPKEAKK